MKSFLNDRLAIKRLKLEYGLYNNLVVGFDFDNTIYDYHKQDLDMTLVIELLQQCSYLGFTMCLYSTPMSIGMTNEDKVAYCKGLRINVNYINDSPLLPNKEKPFFSILLDDRAGLSAAYNILFTALYELDLIT